MKLHFKLFVVIALLFAACVKNKPFLPAYSVPPVFNQENNDSSALARVIMVHGLYNYLSGSVNARIDTAIVDSCGLTAAGSLRRRWYPILFIRKQC
ncbi:hypothetical protein LWM68_33345 [Niabella sp. W65]|nr:hypothetical protein [Niabella sp. W65]MCH7367217.1 hypothetical protein [Niabella sp. W65]ULT42883.1 hypothetical protein KRR40_04855 [Niabella sp. I65]